MKAGIFGRETKGQNQKSHDVASNTMHEARKAPSTKIPLSERPNCTRSRGITNNLWKPLRSSMLAAQAASDQMRPTIESPQSATGIAPAGNFSTRHRLAMLSVGRSTSSQITMRMLVIEVDH